jgi:predicted small secreted protein
MEHYMNTKILTALVFAVLALGGLTACQNTADGFGKDMEKAGRSIQDSVN